VRETPRQLDDPRPAVHHRAHVTALARSEIHVHSHPLFDQLDLALHSVVFELPVDLAGAWSFATNRTCASGTQGGSGSGPFAEVVSARWRGVLMGAGPIGGMAFLLTDDRLYWAKAPEIAPALPVDISLYAYAKQASGRATLAPNLASAYLPGIPVTAGPDLAKSCHVGHRDVRTGRVACLAEADSAAFYVLLFPRDALKMGRKHLWSIRNEIAVSLTEGVRQLLTRRRTGTIPAVPAPD
jgi:hypothetical protein